MEKSKRVLEVPEMMLNILYPRRCPVCHRILRDQKALVCPGCESAFRPITEDYCLKCGSPVKPEEEYCRDCAGKKRSFDEGRGIFFYDQKMRRSLIRYKYYGSREYADYYAVSMYRYGHRNILRWKPDVIIPVPLHQRKLRMRGFNQSGLLAERLGTFLDIPVSEGTLRKIRGTRSQKKLDAAQRRKNLRQAFRAERRLDGLIILLVDDVYTTGSTVEAAAACLKEAGAEKVCFLTLCMGRM